MKKILVVLLLFTIVGGVFAKTDPSEKEFLKKVQAIIELEGVVTMAVVDRHAPNVPVFDIENLLIDNFNMDIRIVDRATLKEAFAELRFQMSGSVTDSDILQVGKMSGARYVTIKDEAYYRLVNIQTGTVIYNMYKKPEDKDWEKQKLLNQEKMFGLNSDMFLSLNLGVGFAPEEKTTAVDEIKGTVAAVDKRVTMPLALGIGYYVSNSVAISTLFGLLFNFDSTVGVDENEYTYSSSKVVDPYIGLRTFLGSRSTYMVYGEAMYSLKGNFGFGGGFKANNITVGFTRCDDVTSLQAGFQYNLGLR